MKKIITLFILLLTVSISAQDIYIPGSPYNDAPDLINKRNSFNREKWFYEQRMFPYNYIPDDAYINAVNRKMEMRSQRGFFSESETWISIGPSPGFYFSYSNISGRTTTVRYDPLNPSIVYIGAAFGGIWKSDNGGLNWVNKSDFVQSLSSGSIAIDPNNTTTIYFGSGEATYSGASYYGRGIFKSVDGGYTWTNYTTGLPSLTYCSRLVIRPDSTNILFAAMGTAGLYRSNDAGETWAQVVSGRCDDVVFSPDGTKAYITGSGTAYQYSTNGGNSFILNNDVFMGTRNHLAICKSSPNNLYIAVYTSSAVTVYKSTNAGLNFTQAFNGFSSFNQAWYDFYIQVNPFDPDYVYVGLIDIWRSTNGGSLFENITNGYSGGNVHVDQHNMDFSPVNPDELIAVNDGGVWKSTNRGNTFFNCNSSLTLTQFYRMTSDPYNSAHLAGGTQDNGTQRTTGTLNWTAAFGGDGGEVCFHPVNSQLILGETQNNGVRRSLDGGQSWSSATSGLTGSGAWVGPLIAHPMQEGTFFTARQQVFKTTNTGSQWTAISSGTSGTIREMAISQSNPNIMFATSGSTIFRSTDEGVTFTNVTAGTPTRTITSIYIHPDSSNVAVVTYSGFGAGKIYKTTNGGTSWFSISGDLPDSPCNDVLIFYPGYATSRYYAALDIGVFVSNDYGMTWTELADGLPNTVAMHLDYNRNANKLRIGTHGRSTWEISPITGIVNSNNNIPKEFSLEQNYPNPFNPSTTIKFSVIKEGNTMLAVYNSLGQLVNTILDKKLTAGTYTVHFDANKLPSGVYFYRLFSDGQSVTKKMILSK